jgi:1-phosphofructokinase
MSRPPRFDVVTVTLNPAIDRAVLIPNFSAGEVNRVEQFSDEAGGKGINVASALATSGFKVAATGFLGASNDSIFVSHLKRLRIKDAFVRIPGETRTGIKVTDPIRNQTTDINFPGIAPSHGSFRELDHTLRSMLQQPTWCVLAGSLPPGVTADVYARWIKWLNREGYPSLLDTSGKALESGLRSGPTIVKPNLSELQGLVGKRLKTSASVLRAGRTLLNTFTQLAVVSMGAEGALFISGDEAFLAMPPKVKVVSTVGAGDAMVAGIVAGRLQKSSLAELAITATAFSLDAITRYERGIRMDRVNRWARKVRLQTVGV